MLTQDVLIAFDRLRIIVLKHEVYYDRIDKNLKGKVGNCKVGFHKSLLAVKSKRNPEDMYAFNKPCKEARELINRLLLE